MAKLDPTKFRISSALKNIIGKELITDDFIAVFELVKNSFDAHAKKVVVIFENIYGDNPRLIIRDDGKGMDREDITKKWLFVAYSAKKEGTENYRDKIFLAKRIHAGAKGIGRFSCDKLGVNLTVYTRRRNSKINKLVVDWNIFEKDSKKEFIDIPIKYSYVNRVPFENFRNGTILEITDLRETWDRQKLLRLKKSLEKLINPNQKNDPKGFSIFLVVKAELEKDSDRIKKNKLREVVNGKIENSIFEDLGVKTTQIKTQISSSGKHITTTLSDRGALIYKVKEKNPYKNILKDVTVHLFALNKPAKINFTKKMGMRSVQYGSVFLYKNGFRIYPFGEEGEDSFGLDRRKIQGQARYLGTRDVIGRIEINGPNPAFQETSSRDGGLIKNKAFDSLKDFFYEFSVRRLERFVVGVLKWGHEGDILNNPKSSQQEMQESAFEIIERLTASDNILDLDYDPKILNILKNRSEKSVGAILHNFKVLAERSNKKLFAKEIRRAQRQYKSLLKAKEEAEAEAERARRDSEKSREAARESAEEAIQAQKEAEEAKAEVKQKTTQNLFLQSIVSRDLDSVISLHHLAGIYTDTIKNDIRFLLRELKQGKKFDTEYFKTFLEEISLEVEKIESITKFATKANFILDSVEMKEDIICFIQEYILNVCAGTIKANDNTTNLSFEFSQHVQGKFVFTFRPIEISIIIDNLINNSRKAGAKKVSVIIKSLTKNSIEILFRDDGTGIPVKNIKSLFQMGFTTTDGSGLGLHHIYKIIKEMNGDILVNKQFKKGAEFILRFRK